MMLSGVRSCSEPRARSLTPSLTLATQRDAPSSLMVIGSEGSRRPWSIQDWTFSRLTGVMSTEKLSKTFISRAQSRNEGGD